MSLRQSSVSLNSLGGGGLNPKWKKIHNKDSMLWNVTKDSHRGRVAYIPAGFSHTTHEHTLPSLHVILAHTLNQSIFPSVPCNLSDGAPSCSGSPAHKTRLAPIPKPADLSADKHPVCRVFLCGTLSMLWWNNSRLLKERKKESGRFFLTFALLGFESSWCGLAAWSVQRPPFQTVILFCLCFFASAYRNKWDVKNAA